MIELTSAFGIEVVVTIDPRRRNFTVVRPALYEPSSAKRFLRRTLPDSWRFAHHMANDLLRQVEYLAWSDRIGVFDTYFLRQAEAMLRSQGLTALVSGPPRSSGSSSSGARSSGASAQGSQTDDRADRFASWTRATLTAVLIDLGERPEAKCAPQALTYLLTREVPLATAAARWIADHGTASIEEALRRLPGYALVLLAASPNDTAERFMARDAFWNALTPRH